MNRLMNGRKLRLLIEPCYMIKAERMREKVCNILAPENEILCQKVAEMSQSQASAETGLGARPRTCLQITCSAETLLPSGVCLRNVNHRQKQTNQPRATATHPGLPDTGKSEV